MKYHEKCKGTRENVREITEYFYLEKSAPQYRSLVEQGTEGILSGV